MLHIAITITRLGFPTHNYNVTYSRNNHKTEFSTQNYNVTYSLNNCNTSLLSPRDKKCGRCQLTTNYFKRYVCLFTVYVTACSQSMRVEIELSIFPCFRRSSVKNGGHIQPVMSEAATVMKELLQHPYTCCRTYYNMHYCCRTYYNMYIPAVGLTTTYMYCCRTFYNIHVLLLDLLQHTCTTIGLITTYMYLPQDLNNIHVLLLDFIYMYLLQDLLQHACTCCRTCYNIHVLLLDLIYMYLLQDCRTYYNMHVPAVGLATTCMQCCRTYYNIHVSLQDLQHACTSCRTYYNMHILAVGLITTYMYLPQDLLQVLAVGLIITYMYMLQMVKPRLYHKIKNPHTTATTTTTHTGVCHNLRKE